jgi:hypothetical protein
MKIQSRVPVGLNSGGFKPHAIQLAESISQWHFNICYKKVQSLRPLAIVAERVCDKVKIYLNEKEQSNISLIFAK